MLVAHFPSLSRFKYWYSHHFRILIKGLTDLKGDISKWILPECRKGNLYAFILSGIVSLFYNCDWKLPPFQIWISQNNNFCEILVYVILCDCSQNVANFRVIWRVSIFSKISNLQAFVLFLQWSKLCHVHWPVRIYILYNGMRPKWPCVPHLICVVGGLKEQNFHKARKILVEVQ